MLNTHHRQANAAPGLQLVAAVRVDTCTKPSCPAVSRDGDIVAEEYYAVGELALQGNPPQLLAIEIPHGQATMRLAVMPRLPFGEIAEQFIGPEWASNALSKCRGATTSTGLMTVELPTPCSPAAWFALLPVGSFRAEPELGSAWILCAPSAGGFCWGRPTDPILFRCRFVWRHIGSHVGFVGLLGSCSRRFA